MSSMDCVEPTEPTEPTEAASDSAKTGEVMASHGASHALDHLQLSFVLTETLESLETSKSCGMLWHWHFLLPFDKAPRECRECRDRHSSVPGRWAPQRRPAQRRAAPGARAARAVAGAPEVEPFSLEAEPKDPPIRETA